MRVHFLLFFATLFTTSHIYAQLNDQNKLDSVLRGDHSKAIIYAILKEKDSMYHYLNSFDVYQTYSFRNLNSLRAFDPYRKEERFKAFLKKYYFPITHWNE